jgi:hypothetical protein
MTLSDQLTKLAAKAKEAEDRAAAAKTKAKAELEQDVKDARASAQAQADQLHKNAQTDKGKISSWWDDMQRSWREHLDTIRRHVDERKATHDLEAAKRNADSAEEDAAFAIDYAYGAIEEAEYAVLDATLARMDADELEAGTKTCAGASRTLSWRPGNSREVLSAASSERRGEPTGPSPSRSSGVHPWLLLRLLDGWRLVGEEGRRTPGANDRMTRHRWLNAP